MDDSSDAVRIAQNNTPSGVSQGRPRARASLHNGSLTLLVADDKICGEQQDNHVNIHVRRTVKVIGWTLGMSVAVYAILGKEATIQQAPYNALLGAVIGFVLGCIFASRLPKDSK